MTELQDSTDAREWAEAFCSQFQGIDLGTMIGWFANAIGAGERHESIGYMQGEVLVNNIAHGWFDNDRTFGDDIALLHSEVSEMFEAFRLWGLTDATADLDRTAPDGWRFAPPKPEGVGSEVADVFIRLLDICHRHDIDLVAEYRRKMEYNRTRPHLHGGKVL